MQDGGSSWRARACLGRRPEVESGLSCPPVRAVLLVLLAVGLAVLAGLAIRRVLRRRALVLAPFPPSWRAILESDVAYYRRLPEPERRRFEAEVRVFLDEQVITGPRQARVSDRLRLLVAASAVMLVFGRRGFRYPRLRDVVIYERAFDDEYREGERENILGMVHGQGPIILSAKHLEQGFSDARDGHHVGLHEFAHVLDFEAGQADGVPTFMPWRAIAPWVGLMREEVERIERGRSVLRPYAATNEAELFAVATEAFFERPRALQARHPELYGLMQEIYGQDPAGEASA